YHPCPGLSNFFCRVFFLNRKLSPSDKKKWTKICPLFTNYPIINPPVSADIAVFHHNHTVITAVRLPQSLRQLLLKLSFLFLCIPKGNYHVKDQIYLILSIDCPKIMDAAFVINLCQ